MAIPCLTSNLAWIPTIRVGGGGSPGVPALGEQMVGMHGHQPGLQPARCLESFLGEATLGHGCVMVQVIQKPTYCRKCFFLRKGAHFLVYKSAIGVSGGPAEKKRKEHLGRGQKSESRVCWWIPRTQSVAGGDSGGAGAAGNVQTQNRAKVIMALTGWKSY